MRKHRQYMSCALVPVKKKEKRGRRERKESSQSGMPQIPVQPMYTNQSNSTAHRVKSKQQICNNTETAEQIHC
jgi:hypothetical protein